MAKNCCWNCKFYIAKGDNEPFLLSGAASNVCVYSDVGALPEKGETPDRWLDRACPTPPVTYAVDTGNGFIELIVSLLFPRAGEDAIIKIG